MLIKCYCLLRQTLPTVRAPWTNAQEIVVRRLIQHKIVV